MYWNLNFQFVFLLFIFSNLFLETTSKSFSKSNADILENVIRFCDANGKRFITVTSYSNSVDKTTRNKKYILLSLTQKKTIYSRFLPSLSAASSLTEMRGIDNTIILSNYNEIAETRVAEEYINLIHRTKIKSSILVISSAEIISRPEQFKMNSLFAALSKFQKNVFFYVVYDYRMNNGTRGVVWNQIIALQNNEQVVTNELTFDTEYKIKER